MINRSHKRKLYLCSAAAAALLTAAALYFSLPSKEVVLELGVLAESNWDVANADTYVLIDTAIRRFEKEHPRVRVHYYSGIRKEDYSEWLSEKALLGKTPDVFMVLSDDFNQFASLGILKQLDGIIDADGSFDAAAYYSTALDAGRYKGQLYALPYEVVPTLMFVNKTLLQKEGFDMPGNDWTWNDLYSICESITKDTDGDGSLDQFGAYNYTWKDAAYANGARLFDENGEHCYFTDERVAEAVRFTKRLHELNQGQKVSQDDFDGSNVAFMPLSFSEYRIYKTYPYKMKKYAQFQWDCITMPAGPKGSNVSEVDTLLMGVSGKTRHPELAWEFLKLLTSDEEIQMQIFQYSQAASVLKQVTASARAGEILKKDMEADDKVINVTLLGQVIGEGQITPKFPRYEGAMTLAEGQISQIYENERNVESTLKILQQSIDNYLKR